MNAVEILCRKRDGLELSAEEITWLVEGHAAGRIPDYQMSAFAMAVYLNGMTDAETAALTDAMRNTGEVLHWDDGLPLVDKHSTGGLGDKVSLILAPLLAANGLRVPMISGRGLGPTGGTLDKLESIPGFRADLSTAEFQQIVNRLGCAITGTTETIAPADRKLYALRDVTATVPSIPLITASIMSKKLAEGLDALVLDVKFGSGTFMKTREDARRLALSLQQTGRRMNVATKALLTNMNQPLGRFAGNVVEVNEAMEALKGKADPDLMEVTLALGAELLASADVAGTHNEARAKLQASIDSGSAFERFEMMVAAQGGDLSQLPPAAEPREVVAERDGYVAAINTENLGWAVIELGGGRRQLGDAIDHTVGLEILVKIGDVVSQGQPWIRVLGEKHPARLESSLRLVSKSLTISNEAVTPEPLIVDLDED